MVVHKGGKGAEMTALEIFCRHNDLVRSDVTIWLLLSDLTKKTEKRTLKKIGKLVGLF